MRTNAGKALASLQWGRDLEVAESPAMIDPRRKSQIASMGPRLGSRGKGIRKTSRKGRLDASMGPRLGSRGKPARPFLWLEGSYVASMGPRLGSRGKPKRRQRQPCGSSLQWGRDLEVAERPGHVIAKNETGALQWGRDLEVAES